MESIYHLSGRTSRRRTGIPYNGEELKQVLDFIRDTRKEGIIRASYGCEGFLGNYEGEVRNTPFFCSAGISVGSVLIDGSLSVPVAASAPTTIKEIYYQDDFWEIWQTKFQPYRDRSWMKKDECARCKYFRYCQGNGMH